MTTSPPCQIPAGTPVLVTGATGFTGSVLIRKLAEAGVSCRAVARPSSRIEPFSDLNIQWFRGQVFDPDLIDAAVDGVQYIFHLATVFREAKSPDELNWNVHVRGTQLLAQAACRNPGFKRFIHVSTIGVHSHVERPPADETYPMNPDDIYQKTKAEAELWLREFASGHRLPFTVLRPAAIFGPRDRRLLKFFKMASHRVFILPGGVDRQWHLIHVNDLADIMILAATHPAALNEVFIAGNAEPVSFVQIAKIIAKELNNRFVVLPLPIWPFLAAACLCEWGCRPFGIEPPLHRRRIAFFTKNRAFDTRKLRTKLDYEPLSNETGLIQTARWYREHGWLNARP